MNDYILKLKDGTEIQFATNSSENDFIGIYNTFTEVDTVRAKMTEENLKGVTFNGEVLVNVIPVRVEIRNVKPGENIEAHFICTSKPTIDILQDQIIELQKALAEITG